MAAPVYTKRLLASTGTTVALASTCPAGKVWIVTDAIAVSSSGVVGDAAFLVSAGGYPITSFHVLTAGALNYQQFTGRVVLVAGEQLRLVPTSGNWVFQVTGYELDA